MKRLYLANTKDTSLFVKCDNYCHTSESTKINPLSVGVSKEMKDSQIANKAA